MNIYDYIINKDFVEYCSESYNEFSDYERAYIVYNSFATISKKIDGLEFIIENTEDEKLAEQLKKIVERMNYYVEEMQAEREGYNYLAYDNIDKKWNSFDTFSQAKQWGMGKMILKEPMKTKLSNLDFVDSSSFKIVRIRKNPLNPINGSEEEIIEIIYNYYGKEVKILNKLIREKLLFASAKEKMPNIFDQYDIVRLYDLDPTKDYKEMICANYPRKAKGCIFYTLQYNKDVENFSVDEDVMYEVFNLVKVDKKDAKFETLLQYEVIQNTLFREGEEKKKAQNSSANW